MRSIVVSCWLLTTAPSTMTLTRRGLTASSFSPSSLSPSLPRTVRTASRPRSAAAPSSSNAPRPSVATTSVPPTVRPSTIVVSGAYWMSLIGMFGRPRPSSVQVRLLTPPRRTTVAAGWIAPPPLLSRIGLSGSAGAVVSKRASFAANSAETAAFASSTSTMRLAVVAALTRKVSVRVGASHATVSRPAATPAS